MTIVCVRGCGVLCAGDDDHSVCVMGCGVLCAGDDVRP